MSSAAQTKERFSTVGLTESKITLLVGSVWSAEQSQLALGRKGKMEGKKKRETVRRESIAKTVTVGGQSF